jgi:hypothetical protein
MRAFGKFNKISGQLVGRRVGGWICGSVLSDQESQDELPTLLFVSALSSNSRESWQKQREMMASHLF